MPSKARRKDKSLPAPINLDAIARKAVARAVKRGLTNIDDLYFGAERGAKRTIVNAYNAMTPRVIRNHTAAGRRAVSRAANIQRQQYGMLHQFLVNAVLSRVTKVERVGRSVGDLRVNGEIVECKRSARERTRQIFADNAKVKTLILRGFDEFDQARDIAGYTSAHDARLVVPGGHPKAMSLTDYVARLKHTAHDKVLVDA